MSRVENSRPSPVVAAAAVRHTRYNVSPGWTKIYAWIAIFKTSINPTRCCLKWRGIFSSTRGKPYYKRRIDWTGAFVQAVRLLYACEGSVLVTGMGKAGLIGKKIMATLGSTGTRAHFLHPAEAVHGDLGRIHENDAILILSQSGETEEVVRLLPALDRWRIPVVAMTARADSTLGKSATVTLALGTLREADALGLAPSTSTTVMLALGDALALVVSRLRDFRREDFAQFHPGGSLGRKLSRVDEVMRPLEECRVASDTLSVKEVLVVSSLPGRRTGAVMLVDESGRLSGIFTDSDLFGFWKARTRAGWRNGSIA